MRVFGRLPFNVVFGVARRLVGGLFGMPIGAIGGRAYSYKPVWSSHSQMGVCFEPRRHRNSLR